ncbi:hypothetical protein H1P_3320003 [Hyella patelloides LEGE 07179]|uniref:Uncharacterized protein n=1 Tax=Hyella patelloides LEGE 07179 TaxID=945734 RepID=A0A563VVE0_9CYAN|nr:hypothetical protein [Hyella patelloides]VEP15409.1 hypothetical protein H1P_3320003 [Hyella patelloides LEGE 07179]
MIQVLVVYFDLYGLILPAGESKWNTLINNFLDLDRVKEVDKA